MSPPGGKINRPKTVRVVDEAGDKDRVTDLVTVGGVSISTASLATGRWRPSGQFNLGHVTVY